MPAAGRWEGDMDHVVVFTERVDEARSDARTVRILSVHSQTRHDAARSRHPPLKSDLRASTKSARSSDTNGRAVKRPANEITGRIPLRYLRAAHRVA